MFRTSYVHLQEDCFVHAALYVNIQEDYTVHAATYGMFSMCLRKQSSRLNDVLDV